MGRNCCIPIWGTCCCTCANLKAVWKHPCHSRFTGSICEFLTWVCFPGMEDTNSGYVNEGHGMCELYVEEKDEKLLRLKQGISVTPKDKL